MSRNAILIDSDGISRAGTSTVKKGVDSWGSSFILTFMCLLCLIVYVRLWRIAYALTRVLFWFYFPQFSQQTLIKFNHYTKYTKINNFFQQNAFVNAVCKMCSGISISVATYIFQWKNSICLGIVLIENIKVWHHCDCKSNSTASSQREPVMVTVEWFLPVLANGLNII